MYKNFFHEKQEPFHQHSLLFDIFHPPTASNQPGPLFNQGQYNSPADVFGGGNSSNAAGTSGPNNPATPEKPNANRTESEFVSAVGQGASPTGAVPRSPTSPTVDEDGVPIARGAALAASGVAAAAAIAAGGENVNVPDSEEWQFNEHGEPGW